MECTFDKNSFFPNEVAKAKVTVDNSQCSLPLTDVRMQVEQEITMQCDGGYFRDVFVLAEDKEDGVPANAEKMERILDVNLLDIRYSIPAKKMKKGIEKDRSPEDIYLASGIQPATNGRYVKNRYFLTVRCNYDGCVCCAETPMAKVPLNIIPMPWDGYG